MRRVVDILLGLLLWLNALTFFVALLAGLSFDEWIIFDIVAVIVCGFVGFIKRVRILQLIAGLIIVAFVLRLTKPLWLLIDVFIIGSCFYIGYLFFKGDIPRLQHEG